MSLHLPYDKNLEIIAIVLCVFVNATQKCLSLHLITNISEHAILFHLCMSFLFYGY